MNKKVITILSDAPFIPTGYRNQAVQLVQHLEKQGHEIHYLANAYSGVTLNGIRMEDGTEIKAKIYGSGFGQDYFANSMSQHLKKTKSDIFIILLDTFMLYPWFLSIDTSPAKTYFWFPSDGGAGLPVGCERILQKVDCPVAMAKFGQKQVGDYYQIKAEYIPHGINVNLFYRLSDEKRAEVKAKWGLTGKFVIGVVARNQPRKNLDRTLKIMHVLRDYLPNAILFLHLDPNDPAQQMFSMPSMIKKYGLENRVVFSGMQAFNGFGWSEMNEVYNAMDVFLLTTSGEGFGIPIIEAMSAEVPVLATSYTTTPELVENHQSGMGIALSGVEQTDMFEMRSQDYDKHVVNGTMTGTWEVERGICDINDAVQKLVWMSEHPTEMRMMGLSGRKAVLEEYDFEKVGKKWEELIQ